MTQTQHQITGGPSFMDIYSRRSIPPLAFIFAEPATLHADFPPLTDFIAWVDEFRQSEKGPNVWFIQGITAQFSRRFRFSGEYNIEKQTGDFNFEELAD